MSLNISKKILIKLIVDIFSLLFVGLFVLFLYLFAKPYKRGYFCNDLTIRYPYRDSTINSYSLAALVLLPIIVAVASVETYRYKNSQYTSKLDKTLLRELYDKYIPFLFGALMSILCTYIAKVSVGRLRPYFYGVCQPNVVCDTINVYQYIEDFECTGTDGAPTEAVTEMRMSYMSGHSSTMAFSMVYLVIYLHKRFPVRNSQQHTALIRALVQGLALNLAIYVGYTRISDYWHHWSDVMIGLIQGALSATLTAYYLSDLCTDDDVDGLPVGLVLSDNNNTNNSRMNTSGPSNEYNLESGRLSIGPNNSSNNNNNFHIRLVNHTSI
ncbi:phospholipid phosphatase 2-like [Oppia nitens]|uniref:phospholipid phosphatase 2-like n=1 Tax=Oppia nitens TaxID=1686743 RepID=UPI0023DA032F|nr:phospholipid phosphatase 2-like [Oppia nitens]